jgi:hypothetical protein
VELVAVLKRHLPLLLPAAVALVLVILSSYVQGVWTQRWDSTAPERLQQFVAVFDSKTIPMEIGTWEGEKLEAENPQDEALELQVAGAVRHISRVYRNPSGDEVHVYMICGMSRSVAKHEPVACYPGAGFREVEKKQDFGIPEADGSRFFTAVFTKESPKLGVETRRVFWAWNADGKWEAPSSPRIRYRGATPLLKLYLTSVPAPTERLPGESACVEFAKLFIPKINTLFFPAAEDTAEASE